MPFITIYFVIIVATFGTASKTASNGPCNCLVNCDKKTGLCPSDCARGWQNGRLIQKYGMRECTTPCPDGTFGWLCGRTCHCRNNSFCGKLHGSCSGAAGGCAPGWISSASQDNCQRGECKGKFGLSCKHNCHCKYNDACHPTTGSCQGAGGCAHGWMSAKGLDNCQQKCPNGTYGYNCLGTCACVTEQACRIADGVCTDGQCANGYPYQYKQQDGTILCLKTCPVGRFGVSCNRHCHCKNNKPCDPVSGSCAAAGGCLAGWKSGPTDNSCQFPKCYAAFGPCCERECHCRINSRCNKVNGSCERAHGCGSGWRSAPGRDDCQLKCPPGTYGLGCKKKSRCATVAAARHTDGACLDDKGCAPKYMGSYRNKAGFTVCLPFSTSVIDKILKNRGK